MKSIDFNELNKYIRSTKLSEEYIYEMSKRVARSSALSEEKSKSKNLKLVQNLNFEYTV